MLQDISIKRIKLAVDIVNKKTTPLSKIPLKKHHRNLTKDSFPDKASDINNLKRDKEFL
jgi:hypothetical protein